MKKKLLNLQIRKNSVIIHLKKKKLKAAATVEALMIMPVILLFFISYAWIIDIFRIHSTIGGIVNEAGLKMVNASYALKESEDKLFEDKDSDLISLIGSVGFSKAYVEKKIENDAVFKSIKNLLCVVDLITEKDAVSIVVSYHINPILTIPGYKGIVLSNSFYSKLYFGNSVNIDGNEWVYITKGSKVYHTSKECSGLISHTHLVYKNHIKEERNEDGSKYYPCKNCKNKDDNSLFYYVTTYGTKYHSDRNCKDLNVTIYKIPLCETGGRRKCFFCD